MVFRISPSCAVHLMFLIQLVSLSPQLGTSRAAADAPGPNPEGVLTANWMERLWRANRSAKFSFHGFFPGLCWGNDLYSTVFSLLNPHLGQPKTSSIPAPLLVSYMCPVSLRQSVHPRGKSLFCLKTAMNALLLVDVLHMEAVDGIPKFGPCGNGGAREGF